MELKEVGEPNSQKQRTQTIYIIRHGESLYNEFKYSWCTWLTCQCLGDPGIVDPSLSAKGQQQAEALQTVITEGKRLPELLNVQVIVTSPLRRALSTAEIAFKSKLSPATPSSDPTSAPAAAHQRVVPWLVTPLCAEIMDTYGDVGSPIAEVSKAYPSADWSAVHEQWWYNSSENRKPAKKIKKEPSAVVEERIRDFLSYLAKLPYQTIAVVGHSAFFARLAGGKSKLQNCGVARITLASIPSSDDQTNTKETVQKYTKLL